MQEQLPKHHNLYVGICNTLHSVFFEDKYADKALEFTFKQHPKWGSKDRSFVAQTVYDLVRWKRWVEAGLNQEIMPSNLWSMLGCWFLLNSYKLPNLVEFKSLKTNVILKNHRINVENLAVMHSLPNWLYDFGTKELGQSKWIQELEALNKPAATVLRCNTLKISIKQLQNQLKKENKINSQTHATYPSALILEEKANVFATDAFKNGWFELQDASSQLVAEYLEVEPGMRVIDACAGAGGKSLHLSNLMKNKGQIIAMDIYAWKLKELKRRAKRNSVQNIQTRLIENSKTIKRLHNSADRLLIDAPCSGIGVLKRNPDAKWKLKPKFIKQIQQEQQQILNQYAKLLKVNGKMVYATCSIFPSENEEQTKLFLANNGNYKLIKQQSIWPSESGFDGFYMALMQRNE